MTLLAEVGTFTAKLSTGNQTISLANAALTPKFIFIWSANLLADGFSTLNFGCCGYWAAGAGKQAVEAWYDNDAVTPSANARRFNGAKIIEYTDLTGAANFAAATVSSVAAGSFTLNWTLVQGDARLFNYLVLGGSDITNIDLNVLTSPTTASIVSHDIGFPPDCVIGIGGAWSDNPGGANHLIATLGTADTAIQASTGWASRHNVGTSNTSCRHATARFYDGMFDDAANAVATITLNAAGYDLNWTTVPATARYFAALAIKGIRCKVVKTVTPTSAGVQSITGAAAQPVAALLHTAGNNNTVASNDIKVCIGAGANAAQQACAGWTSSDAVGLTVCDRSQEQDEVLQMNQVNQSVIEEANWQGVTAAGCDINWTTINVNQRNFSALMFSPAPVVGGAGGPSEGEAIGCGLGTGL